MRLEITPAGIALIREPGDKALSHESEVAHHIRRLLNTDGGGWTRFYPHKHGLTDSRQGVIDWSRNLIYWHAEYQRELAHKAFNAGRVFFNGHRED